MHYLISLLQLKHHTLSQFRSSACTFILTVFCPISSLYLPFPDITLDVAISGIPVIVISSISFLTSSLILLESIIFETTPLSLSILIKLAFPVLFSYYVYIICSYISIFSHNCYSYFIVSYFKGIYSFSCNNTCFIIFYCFYFNI